MDPYSFDAEAWLIRVFGLSLFAWRFVCFLGLVLCVFVCSALVKAAGGNRWTRLSTAMFITLAGSVAGTLPGRWDFITSGLFLSGVLLLVGSIKRTGSTLLWRAALSGRSYRLRARFVPSHAYPDPCCTGRGDLHGACF